MQCHMALHFDYLLKGVSANVVLSVSAYGGSVGLLFNERHPLKVPTADCVLTGAAIATFKLLHPLNVLLIERICGESEKSGETIKFSQFSNISSAKIRSI